MKRPTAGLFSLIVGIALAPGTADAQGSRFGDRVTVEAPRITRFHVGGVRNPASVVALETVPLLVTYSGADPTHYRLSERSDFRGARWTPFPGPGMLNHRFREEGERRLYLQLAVRGQMGARTLTRPSNVVNDAVRVLLAPTRCVAELRAPDGKRLVIRLDVGQIRRLGGLGWSAERITNRGGGGPEYRDGELWWRQGYFPPALPPLPPLPLPAGQSRRLEPDEFVTQLHCLASSRG